MTDQFTPPGAEAPAPAMSTRDAAKMLSESRWKRQESPSADNSQSTNVDPLDQAKVDQANDPHRALREPPIQRSAPQTEAHTEQQTEQTQPAEEAPIEPPRSWTKEEKERFRSLPRETQEYLTQRETERDTGLRNRQNELAKYAQSLQAQAQAVEQARRQYEQALPVLAQQLNDQYAGEFGDIRTQADVDKLAAEDWPRFARWQAHTMKQQAVQNQMQAASQRAQQEYQGRWQQFTASEDRKFAELAPEMADPAKARALVEDARKALTDVGYTEGDLAKAINGEASLSIRDHRLQLLIRKAVLYDRAQVAAKTPAPRNLPPVQRPGSGSERRDQGSLEIKALETRAAERPTAKNMAALLVARRRAS